MTARPVPMATGVLRAAVVAVVALLGGCADMQREFQALAPSEDFIRDLIERVDTYAGYPAPRLDPDMRPSGGRPPVVAPPPAQAVPPVPPPAPPGQTGPRTYVVQPGDTVFGLARTFGITPQALAAANDLGDRATLRTGERLVIPGTGPAGGPPPTPTPADKPADGTLTAQAPRAPIAGQPLSPVTSAPLPPVTSTPLAPPPSSAAPQTTVTPIVPTVTAPAPAAGRTEAERRLTAPDAAPTPQPAATPPAAPAPPPDVAATSSQEDTRTAALSPSAPAGDDGGGRFGWPLRGQVLSGFGSKADGVRNDGINIKAETGAPVHAAASGVVVYAGNELRGFGELLLIRHTDGLTSAYAHNSELLVRRGQRVRRGQIIARVGQTGSVTSPQLHFEIRQGSQPVDPMQYLGS